MKCRISFRAIITFLVSVLISCCMASGSPVPVSDTAGLNSMAREVRELLKDKSKAHQADSVLKTAYQLTDGNKEQITPLLHWASAEMALFRKDFGNACKYAAAAMKSPVQQIGPQAYGNLSIFYARTCQYTGQFSAAIEVLEKNIEFARLNHLKHILPQTFLDLAEVYTALDKPEETIRALGKALEAADQEQETD